MKIRWSDVVKVARFAPDVIRVVKEWKAKRAAAKRGDVLAKGEAKE